MIYIYKIIYVHFIFIFAVTYLVTHPEILSHTLIKTQNLLKNNFSPA